MEVMEHMAPTTEHMAAGEAQGQGERRAGWRARWMEGGEEGIMKK